MEVPEDMEEVQADPHLQALIAPCYAFTWFFDMFFGFCFVAG